MIEVIAILIAFAVGYGFGKLRQAPSENRGEWAVRFALSKNFTDPSYHLLNNITLPFADGTTQIDHVLISTKGIFVIETKHYTGWIFGNANASIWTQVKFRRKYKFQNPLHQNHKHLKVIQKLLDFVPHNHIHPLVVFTGDATFKTGKPKGVFDVDGLVEHIHQFTDEVLTNNRIQFCVGRLECHRKLVSSQTDAEHRMYLNLKYGTKA